MSLTEVLLELLQKYRLSQRKLAEKSGVNYVTINRIMNDYQFKVTSDTIDKLAVGIGCTIDERDQLHQAAGRVPEEVKGVFSCDSLIDPAFIKRKHRIPSTAIA
jgi:transcriptional regulator with XRE-family HTH domain